MLNSQSSGRITGDLIILIPRKASEKIKNFFSGRKIFYFSLSLQRGKDLQPGNTNLHWFSEASLQYLPVVTLDWHMAKWEQTTWMYWGGVKTRAVK